MKKYIASAAVIAIIIAAYILMQPLDMGDADTIVWADNQTVSTMDTFFMNISCSPAQPIKAFEFKVSFNASLLQANSVIEGDIFKGYDTFFNPGIINNTAGTIIHIYNLILGMGNVSDNGTMVIINFTAKTTGFSELNLSLVGVTNETEYINISICNGSIQIEETIVYAMMVNSSWNLISWPTADIIPNENITVIYNNTVYTWQEACDSIIIAPFVYMYDGTYVLTDYFYPYHGYWLYSHHDVVVLIYDK